MHTSLYVSNPLAFWTEQDVLRYIKDKDLKICSVYGEVVSIHENEMLGQVSFDDLLKTESHETLTLTGLDRTGCMFCGYGCHLEKMGESRFEKMKTSHPKQYEWIMKPTSEGGLGYKEVIDWINDNGKLHIKY